LGLVPVKFEAVWASLNQIITATIMIWVSFANPFFEAAIARVIVGFWVVGDF
jgi:hypothetical protein